MELGPVTWTQDGKILCKEDKRINFFLTNFVQEQSLRGDT